MNNQQLLKYRRWFESGRKAKVNGFERISPFYENLTAEYFFNCGFDGQGFEEATELLQEKLKDLLQANPVVKDAINELINRRSTNQ